MNSRPSRVERGEGLSRRVLDAGLEHTAFGARFLAPTIGHRVRT